MDGSNLGVTREVRSVKREDVAKAMQVHGCHEPSVVNLYPLYGVGHNETAPLGIECSTIRQQRVTAFKTLYSEVGIGD
jgi:hypothetical protein